MIWEMNFIIYEWSRWLGSQMLIFKSETVDEKPRPKKNRFQDRKADSESEVKSG